MARGVCRFCNSQSSMPMLSRSVRRVRSRRIASMARAIPHLSARERHGILQNDPAKCNGAGSRPRRSVEIRPPGSRK